MDTKERDELIAKLLSEGVSLSDVQKQLRSEHDLNLTYMELRLIALDLEVDWSKQDAEEEQQETIDDITDVQTDDQPAGDGKTTVEVSKLVRPGALVSGDVTFKSGARAEWALDQMGRLSLNPVEGTGKPDEDDLQEFQVELQRVVQQHLGG